MILKNWTITDKWKKRGGAMFLQWIAYCSYWMSAFDSKYFEPDLFENFQITKFQYLSENCDGAKNQKELSFVRYKRQFKRKWEGSSVIFPQTHLESVIILDQNKGTTI
jgi:hypothetical protein